jgi:hypothetical protein
MWQKVLSEKYQQYYWFNSVTGESKWEDPMAGNEGIDENLAHPTKRQRVEETTSSVAATSADPTEGKNKSMNAPLTVVAKKPDIEIAIIVPFRDLHIEQKRSEQLARFIPEMTRSIPPVHHHLLNFLPDFFKVPRDPFTSSSSSNRMMAGDSIVESY